MLLQETWSNITSSQTGLTCKRQNQERRAAEKSSEWRWSHESNCRVGGELTERLSGLYQSLRMRVLKLKSPCLDIQTKIFGRLSRKLRGFLTSRGFYAATAHIFLGGLICSWLHHQGGSLQVSSCFSRDAAPRFLLESRCYQATPAHCSLTGSPTTKPEV